jgi:hypothetical protein
MSKTKKVSKRTRTARKILVGASIVVALCLSFVLGSMAADDWKTAVVNQANTDINAAAFNKTEELLANMDTLIEDKVMTEVTPVIDTKETQAVDEIQTYFDTKVDQLVDSESANLNTTFDTITDSAVSRQIAKLEEAFNPAP